MAVKRYVVLPCAGKGKRMGGSTPKFLLDLGGMTVLEKTLKNLHGCPEILGITLCISPEFLTEMHEEILPSFSPEHRKRLFLLVTGGSERQFSIWNGVQATLGRSGAFREILLNPTIARGNTKDLVAVHDAVRPFAGPNLFSKVFEAAEQKGAALIAIPAQDTMKRCQDTQVTATVDRSNLWQAQTPQAFRFSTLIAANEKALADRYMGTDDASLVEHLGQAVYCVPGEKFNLKITTQEDLDLARAIYKGESECA